MTGMKITLAILILYTLIASFLIKKTRSFHSCITVSLVFAVGSIYLFTLITEHQNEMEAAVVTAFDSLQQLLIM